MVKSRKQLLLAFVSLSALSAALLFSPLLAMDVQAAQAPCQPIGGRKHNCRFWTATPLEGQSNGTIAPGTNWVICQAKGKTVTVGGWRNNWWAWTLRDSGTGTYGSGWGWVNAVYAQGGSDFEGFAGVPLCYGPPLPPQSPLDWIRKL